jgi:hypothetical protein
MHRFDRRVLRRALAVIALAIFAAAPALAVDVEDRSGYNTEYLFGFTRAVVDSTIASPLKPVLFLFTVPTDIALLPIAAIGGLFG